MLMSEITMKNLDSKMNPTIHLHRGCTTLDIQRLMSIILSITGENYGFHPNDLIDTTILDFTLTRCGKPKIRKESLRHIDSIIRCFIMAQQMGAFRITWN